MPERQLSIAAYTVGASLCAISLLYVFGPGFAFDNNDLSSSRRRIVGLQNPHNLCFCNSVLQALANSPGLRKYLIREIHRRNLDGPEVYKVLPEEIEGRGREAALQRWKQERLQEGLVTHALKVMLDRLNERPLHKKTISAADFIRALEVAFRTVVSSDQQDAQEFLHVVLERLCDEYHAGKKARRKFKARNNPGLLIEDADLESLTLEEEAKESKDETLVTHDPEKGREKLPELEAESEPEEVEDEFPFEGLTESEIECQSCGFVPKPAISTFVTLTLNVPHVNSTTLNRCFDGIFKEETIEGYRCDKCRLVYAKAYKQRELERCTDEVVGRQLQADLQMIDDALEEDPERELKEANLPDGAPKRIIKKVVRISRFPKVLAIHLSRSLYSVTSLSTKNTAKVTFPDGLQVGGLLNPHNYRLSSVVMHKGGHNSGHYETFRRQYNPIPFSTPNSFGTHGVYSQQASPNPSSTQIIPSSPLASKPSSPLASKRASKDVTSPNRLSVQSLDPSILSAPSESSRLGSSHSSQSSQSGRSSMSLSLRSKLSQGRPPTSTPRDPDASSSATVFSEKTVSAISLMPPGTDVAKLQKRQAKLLSRWWRVSDEKVKEAKTSDVLNMQKEVYLLFYEAEN
jgi:ubiquitin carboxyl-terminal hydrolase 16